jgi:mono/diheme cytochrome c family protein
LRRLPAAALAALLAHAPAALAQDPELGRKVFTEIAQPSCGLCHTLKAAGSTGTIGPSLDELQPEKARVMDTVRTGIGPMPPFADKLTPQQIEAVADYVARVAGK